MGKMLVSSALPSWGTSCFRLPPRQQPNLPLFECPFGHWQAQVALFQVLDDLADRLGRHVYFLRFASYCLQHPVGFLGGYRPVEELDSWRAARSTAC